jgi:hypothetical protein
VVAGVLPLPRRLPAEDDGQAGQAKDKDEPSDGHETRADDEVRIATSGDVKEVPLVAEDFPLILRRCRVLSRRESLGKLMNSRAIPRYPVATSNPITRNKEPAPIPMSEFCSED